MKFVTVEYAFRDQKGANSSTVINWRGSHGAQLQMILVGCPEWEFVAHHKGLLFESVSSFTVATMFESVSSFTRLLLLVLVGSPTCRKTLLDTSGLLAHILCSENDLQFCIQRTIQTIKVAPVQRE